MSNYVKYIAGAVVLILVLGAGVLFLWEIPAPTHAVEKDIPVDRLGR